MKKGDIVEALVTRLDFPDKGIARTDDGVSLKVKGVIPGQRVLCRIKRNGAGKKSATLVSVVQKGEIETEKPCPHQERCGGCAYQTLTAEAELKLKEGLVRDLILPALEAQDIDCEWDPPLDSPIRNGYRNKMEFTWGDSFKGGPLALGLHVRGSMYDIETVSECRIVDEDYRKILTASLEFFSPMYERGEVDFYHRMTGEGFLRHLLVRKSASTGEILADLVTTSGHDPSFLDGLAEKLLALRLDGKIAGILHTVNDSRADTIIDEGTEILYGADHFYEVLLGLRFRISPFSFFQTNSRSAEVLYKKVREYASEVAGDRAPVIYDLYSGTGTIARILADIASKVAGIELVEEAVEAARTAAGESGTDNCFFFAGDVLKLVDDPAVTETVGKPDLIILDPPRDGIHPKALPKIISFGVENIIYISCKPTSLARDLEVFIQSGYQAVRMCVVNQFPTARHVETVVLLDRETRKDREYVYFDYEPKDDEYLNLMKKKATYAQVKDWVKETYGVQVPNLYIAQVKDKMGMDKRENYNKGRERHHVPSVPEDKEIMIRAAFKHFGVVLEETG